MRDPLSGHRRFGHAYKGLPQNDWNPKKSGPIRHSGGRGRGRRAADGEGEVGKQQDRSSGPQNTRPLPQAGGVGGGEGKFGICVGL